MKFEHAGDFCLYVRHRWNPGEDVEIALGRAWVLFHKHGYLPSDRVRLEQRLTALEVQEERAAEMIELVYRDYEEEICTAV